MSLSESLYSSKCQLLKSSSNACIRLLARRYNLRYIVTPPLVCACGDTTNLLVMIARLGPMVQALVQWVVLVPMGVDLRLWLKAMFSGAIGLTTTRPTPHQRCHPVQYGRPGLIESNLKKQWRHNVSCECSRYDTPNGNIYIYGTLMHTKIYCKDEVNFCTHQKLTWTTKISIHNNFFLSTNFSLINFYLSRKQLS